MRKMLLGIALACGAAWSQTVANKLKDKTIYLHRQFVDGGHANGFTALRTLLESNVANYGYKLEISTNPLNQAGLDALFSRLIPASGVKPANGIDVLIFCQGEGDWNITSQPPIPGGVDRMAKVNTHVRAGGGLMIVHAAAGREISRSGWTFGAKLMTDWFLDEYAASPAISGNGGHFSSGTLGTITMDEETLKEKDPSAFFIRNLMYTPKASKGMGAPVSNDQVRGEWYHFNGGFRYEDGSGGAVKNDNNKFQPARVRGHMGHPDTGIGPAKIFAVLTKIQGANYTPPGKGRHVVWGREVSNGVFDATKSATNGRFVYFNPGHAGDEYTLGNGWIGNLFMSTLRWVVKEDRGCTNPNATNPSAFATVDDGSCVTVSLGRDAFLTGKGEARMGRLSVRGAALDIAVEGQGAHAVAVLDVNGKQVFRAEGQGARSYRTADLQRGFYLAHVKVGGEMVRKMVTIK